MTTINFNNPQIIKVIAPSSFTTEPLDALVVLKTCEDFCLVLCQDRISLVSLGEVNHIVHTMDLHDYYMQALGAYSSQLAEISQAQEKHLQELAPAQTGLVCQHCGVEGDDEMCVWNNDESYMDAMERMQEQSEEDNDKYAQPVLDDEEALELTGRQRRLEAEEDEKLALKEEKLAAVVGTEEYSFREWTDEEEEERQARMLHNLAPEGISSEEARAIVIPRDHLCSGPDRRLASNEEVYHFHLQMLHTLMMNNGKYKQQSMERHIRASQVFIEHGHSAYMEYCERETIAHMDPWGNVITYSSPSSTMSVVI